MVSWKKRFLAAIFAAFAMLGAAACGNNNGDVDADDDVSSEAGDVADETGELGEELGEEAGEAAEGAGDALEDAGDEIEESTDDATSQP